MWLTFIPLFLLLAWGLCCIFGPGLILSLVAVSLLAWAAFNYPLMAISAVLILGVAFTISYRRGSRQVPR